MRIATWNVNSLKVRLPHLLDWLGRVQPDVVCLQEVPVWALRHLAAWSGMTSIGAVAARPRLASATFGKLITGGFRVGLNDALVILCVVLPFSTRSVSRGIREEPREGQQDQALHS